MSSDGDLNKIFARWGEILPILFFPFIINSCNHLFYHPDQETFRPTPTELSLAKRDIFFPAEDQTMLHGWFFQSPRSKGTVLQFHGNAQNISSHYLSLAWLPKYGYNLFTFDYRGYGRSSRISVTPKGVRQDGLAALKKALNIHKEVSPKGKFVVIGQSLGGAVVLKALEDLDKPGKVDLVVLESSFVSYQKIAFEKLTSHWSTWFFAPISFILISDRTSAKNSLDRLSIPTLVVHSENDPVVPFSFGRNIYEQVGAEQKWLWKISGDGHIASFHSPVQQKKLIDLLEREIVR